MLPADAVGAAVLTVQNVIRVSGLRRPFVPHVWRDDGSASRKHLSGKQCAACTSGKDYRRWLTLMTTKSHVWQCYMYQV